MHPIEAPKANPENLLTIISGVYDGKVVVPEFQRSFVWWRQDIEELLASIFQGYFVGTLLLLDTPVRQPMFPFRKVEGLEKVNPGADPNRHGTVRLVLDGQQRVSSLFYALHEPDIPLKFSTYPHKFYLRLDLALKGDIDDAVTGISTRDRRRFAEIQALVQAQQALPISLLRETARFYKWLYHEQHVWNGPDRSSIEALYQRFANFMVPVVSLSPETGKENIVNIFERINRTGISLSLFDLSAARVYQKGVRLRDLWKEFEQENTGAGKAIKPEFLLKVMAIWQGKDPKRGQLLDLAEALDKVEFERQWKYAAQFISRAYERIRSLQGYGAVKNDLIPYTTIP
ncbi:MAG: DUF262 domain-containing protein [Acidobacteria bacterium]|nr:DUF262 domain-containing protein [Acidobacteriota bacterium]